MRGADWVLAAMILLLILSAIIASLLPAHFDFPGRWCGSDSVRAACFRDWIASYAGWAAFVAAWITVRVLLTQIRLARLALNDQRLVAFRQKLDSTRNIENFAKVIISQCENIIKNCLKSESIPSNSSQVDSGGILFSNIESDAYYDTRLYLRGLQRNIDAYRNFMSYPQRSSTVSSTEVRQHVDRIQYSANELLDQCDHDLNWLRDIIQKLEDPDLKKPPRKVSGPFWG